MDTYDEAMRRALELASHGPAVGANPQVGCVLLSPAGEVLAEGWHRGAGTPHAEIVALDVLRAAHGPDAARGTTAVVTLEPCNHVGRTPPCSEALIAAGVSRVVYGVDDPGPNSSGGALRLREAGVEIVPGVLAAACTALIEVWLTATRRRRPFVTVKWAATLDGRTAASDGSSRWITGAAARQRVHEQRGQADAVLVTTGTVLADDPQLTARGDAGELLPHQPVPVVVGERSVPDDAKLRAHPSGLIETGTRDVAAVLTTLFERDIRRVLVEGGPALVDALISADLVDAYAIFLAPLLLGGDRLAIGDLGIPTLAQGRRLRIDEVETLGPDLLITARPLGRETD